MPVQKNKLCESSSTSSMSTSSEEDRRSIEPFLQIEETVGRASDPRECALYLLGYVFIPSIWSICDTHKHSHCSASAEEGPALRGTLVKAPLLKRAFQELSVHSGSHSQCGPSAPSFDDVWAGRNTQSVMWSAFALMLCLCLFLGGGGLRHAGAVYVAGIVTWQTTVNKTHWTQIVNDTHRKICWITKAGAGCTLRAFKLPGYDVTHTWCLAINWTDYTYDSELDIAEDVPLAFSDAARVPGGEQSKIVLNKYFGGFSGRYIIDRLNAWLWRLWHYYALKCMDWFFCGLLVYYCNVFCSCLWSFWRHQLTAGSIGD